MANKWKNWTAGASLSLAVLAGLMACTGGATDPSAKPTAVATIFAYHDALRAIGGNDVNVVMLLPPGRSPHEYLPVPQNKSDVMKARLIVKNGLELDPWIDKLAADNKTATVLSIGDSETALHTEETDLPGAEPADTGTAPAKQDDHGNHDHHEMGNPHVWLDPTVQMRVAEKIRDALIKIDPAHQVGYSARTDAYLADLRKLDADFMASTATFKHKEFIGFHSAYAYLARRYGLVQIASFREIGSGELNPMQIRKVVALIQERKIPVVFSETAFDTRQAEIVTQQTGVKLGTLQPLETYDNADDTYVKLMRENLASLEKYMKD